MVSKIVEVCIIVATARPRASPAKRIALVSSAEKNTSTYTESPGNEAQFDGNKSMPSAPLLSARSACVIQPRSRVSGMPIISFSAGGRSCYSFPSKAGAGEGV